MAEEIERKFLVASNDWRPAADRGTRFLQAYVVAGTDRTLRVRIIDGTSARLTVKIGRDALVRQEFEYDIPLADAHALAGLRVGEAIEKIRYRVAFAGFVWEVDVYDGPLAGLVVAEVELASPAERPDLPGWLAREITGEAAFGNRTLALHGLPASWHA